MTKPKILIFNEKIVDSRILQDLFPHCSLVFGKRMQLRYSLLKTIQLIICFCCYNCELNSCLEIFRLAVLLRDLPFGIIRPVLLAPGIADKRLFIFSLIKKDKPINLTTEQINIIEEMKYSKYYACSSLSRLHPSRPVFKISQIQREIACNPDKHSSLVDLASLVNYSPTWLSRKFHDISGLSIIKFIWKMKLCHALWTIYATEKPIKTIALESGCSPSYFDHRFRHFWGINPAEIRK